jgi:hypothetical protein
VSRQPTIAKRTPSPAPVCATIFAISPSDINMTPKCSPLAPLTNIQSISLCQNDLITENNVETVDDLVIETFELAWNQLLRESGGIKGRHHEIISALQLEALRLKVAKDNLKVELTKQSAFVRNKRDEMEASYLLQFDGIQANLAEAEEKAKAKLDMIGTAIESAALTLPWQHFMRELDRLGTMSTLSSSHDKTHVGQELSRYTSRALVLATSYGKSGNNQKSTLVNQRAYCVENALLKSHIQMLTMEIDRHKIIDSLQREISEEIQKLHK